MVILGNSNKMLSVRIKKALYCSRINSVTKAHNDLEFLVFGWIVQSHTFILVWREFGPILEDVFNIMALPIYGETCNWLDTRKVRQG